MGQRPSSPNIREQSGVSMRTHFSAFVKDNRLYLMGMAETSAGSVPFTHHERLGEPVPDGPINLTEPPPPVQACLERIEKPLMQYLLRQQMVLGAENLVERSRVGDQNAMAIMAGVRKRAYQGNPRARAAFRMLQAYIEANPVQGGAARFPGARRPFKLLEATLQKGPEEYALGVSALVPLLDDPMKAACKLSHGRPIDSAVLTQVLAMLPETDEGKENAFKAGYFGKRTEVESMTDLGRRVAAVGLALSWAKRLQEVRKPETPIRYFSKVCAWELGE